ncbi:hypothetical protein EYF80_002090 [Liparis tanakae]|uniref:Uncharacterized protein n=1 Tax=Liparis tanakae TaxID=230148 RepID=A0A4Z2JDA3_9TELE|nr:hypothetical protein EYF80_002090 [Liparis tanakae]
MNESEHQAYHDASLGFLDLSLQGQLVLRGQLPLLPHLAVSFSWTLELSLAWSSALVELKLVLLGLTTLLVAFQLVLQAAAGALHLGHLIQLVGKSANILMSHRQPPRGFFKVPLKLLALISLLGNLHITCAAQRASSMDSGMDTAERRDPRVQSHNRHSVTMRRSVLYLVVDFPKVDSEALTFQSPLSGLQPLQKCGPLHQQGLQLLSGRLKLCLPSKQLPPQVTMLLLRTGPWRQAILLKPHRNLVQLCPHLRTQRGS